MRAFLVLVSCLAAATGTAARVAAATNAKAAAAAVFLPPPDQVDLMKQVTDAQLDGTIRRLYMQALVANTPPAKLREALESLATPEVKKRIQIDINYLFDHPDEIVPYFTAKDADEVLLLVGSVLKGQKVDPFNLTPSQQNAIKQALETNNVDNWMARKYKKSKADRDEVYQQTPPAEAPPSAPLTPEQAQAKLEEPRHTSCSSADDDDGLQAVVAALRQAKLQCPEDADACCDITNTRAASGSEASSSASSMKEGPDVGPLLALCPASISSCFLQHCLQHNFHSNLEAAANWLLEADHAQLLREQQAWERDMQQRQREQEDVELQKKMQKRLIVQKFDLRAVSDASAGCKKGGKQQGPDLLPAPKKGQQESKLRYRDGRVVSTKGEKVIVEKVGEDWDGGSRGKVFTKGKRGKGFH